MLNFKYKVLNGRAIITSYNGSEKIVHIPTEIDGLRVVEIAPMCFFENKYVEAIFFPKYVSIENNVIVDCPNLKTIYIPDVFTIGNFIEDCEETEIFTTNKLTYDKLKSHNFKKVFDSSIFDTCFLSSGVKIVGIKEDLPTSYSICIPNYFNGQKVIELKAGLFSGMELDEVILNDFIEELPIGCFADAFIRKIGNTNNIKKIDEECFYVADISEPIHFENVEEISEKAFFSSNMEVTFGNNLKSIKETSFESSPIKEISLLNIGTIIPKDSFKNCKNLEKAILPKTIEVLEEESFAYCDNLKIVENLDYAKVFKAKAFMDCRKHKVNISFDNKTFEASVFTNNIFPETIEIKNCILGCGNFAGAKELKKVIFTKEYKNKEIPSFLFRMAPNLIEVILNDSIEKIGEGAFAYDIIKSINLENVTIIETGAFKNSNIESIYAPNIEFLGEYAFEWCPNLLEASFDGSKLEIFPKGLFSNSGLKKIIFPKNLKVIKSQALFSCQLKELRIPSTVEELGSSFVSYNESLEYLYIPSSIKTFDVTSIANITQSPINIIFEEINLDENNLIFNANTMKEATIDISKCTFNKLPRNIFSGLQIKKLILPKKIKEIGSRAFSNAKIEELEMDYDSIKKVETGAFSYSEIKNLEVPKNAIIIEKNAFFKANLNLKKVEISATQIADAAFKAAGKMDEIQFLSIPKTLGEDNFKDCIIKKIKTKDKETSEKLKKRSYFQETPCLFEIIK